jgi:ribose/xylose/arabinose/galactoside ABC-type transport system permease subunit
MTESGTQTAQAKGKSVRESAAQGIKSWLNIAGLVLAWVAIFGVFSYLMPQNFPTFSNFVTILRQQAAVFMVALGMTYVIVSGGIDLSVSSVAAFGSVVIAWFVMRGYSPAVALLGGLAAGVLCGLANGIVVTRLKVVPFIVTLGTMLAVRGLAKGLANEQKIDAPETWLNELVATLRPEHKWMLFPAGVWATLILALLMALLLRYTRFGRHVVAVGSNEHAARLCGVPIDRVKLSIYAISGLFAGLAGLVIFSRLSVGDPTVAAGLELDAIAAVVIGGASLNGGQGSIVGSLLGALIMATIRAGSSQYGLSNWVQEVLTGGIIVLAVALDRLRVRGQTT